MKIIYFYIAFFVCFNFDVFGFENNEEAVNFIVSVINTEGYKDDFGDNFSDLFKKHLPESKIKKVFTELKGKYGNIQRFKDINKEKGIFEVEFENIILTLSLSLDEGKINSLYFSNPRIKGSFSIDTLEKVSGEKSILLEQLNNNKILFEYNKDLPLEISSAFKIYLLIGVIEKEKNLSKILKLDKKYYSFPPYLLYSFPEGSPLTLYTYLFMMIAQSDNTAADHIISFLGEDNIPFLLSKYGNINYKMNIPFLYTSDLFRIFYSTYTIKEYINLSLEEKKVILNKLREDNKINSFISAKRWKEIEDVILKSNEYHTKIGWFASASDMCRAFKYIVKSKQSDKIREILGVNTDLSAASLISDDIRERYKYLGGKIGSKYGVISANFLIITNNDVPYCLSVTINSSKPIDYNDIYIKIISQLLNNRDIK